MKRNYLSDSFEYGLSHCSTPLRIALATIRRKLWIRQYEASVIAREDRVDLPPER